ncbi:MAG: hypothetical protein H0V33_01585, partial [Acidimicrobiia bacterium]|nr:hypothetical protein [Acidimicrobiia bacterium]
MKPDPSSTDGRSDRASLVDDLRRAIRSPVPDEHVSILRAVAAGPPSSTGDANEVRRIAGIDRPPPQPHPATATAATPT